MVAKVDIKFFNFFVLILGLRLQRYLTNTKREPPKKFLETLSLFFQPKFLKKGEVYQNWIGHKKLLDG